MAITFKPELLQAIDADIRAGRQVKARKDLTELCRVTVPREHRVPVATLARRCGQAYLGLRLLSPLVRPSGKKVSDATVKEKAEYAAGLINVGAAGEALDLLDSLGKEAPIESGLYKAFAFFTQWEYGKAIPVLRPYVKAESLNDYQRMVGNVNLAAALVTERHYEEAETLLTEIEKLSQGEAYNYLHGVILELHAQNNIFQKKWGIADSLLERAFEKLKDSESWEALFVRKWMAISALLQGRDKTMKGMLTIRNEAVNRGHGETVRDIDRYLALQRQDQKLLIHVYFGTPYQSFRRRLLSDATFQVDLPQVYELRLGPDKGKEVWIDLARGELGPTGESLKYNSQVHRLLKELCHDFYKGSSLTGLHARVYSGEYFNPVSTPAKMHRLMVRLREWFEEEKVPLRVEEKRSSYRLVGDAPCVLKITEREVRAKHPQLEQLENRFIDGKFSIREASRFLKTPNRSLLRLLEKGMADGLLEREGRAGATRYRFKRVSR